MPKPLEYRRRLLAIVDAFLDPSPASQARARRLVDRLYHDPRRHVHTIDDLVWGTFIVELTDWDYTTSLTYLYQTREALTYGSPVLHRAYLNFDFRDDFTDIERDWHRQLSDLAARLQVKPFPWMTSGRLPFEDESGPQAQYLQRAQAIRELSEQSPPPFILGEETLYHFVLRTASAVLTNIDPWASTRLGFLAVGGNYTQYHWNPMDPDDRHRPPDATLGVEWAARALRSITLEDWVWFTAQITATAYLVSLH